MPKSENPIGVLCDTSFFIRLNRPSDALHQSAKAYLRFLVDREQTLYVSTIALAEYAVRDPISHLPLRHFRIIPFNIDHAQKAGEFAAVVFHARKSIPVDFTQRAIIPNDTKMFAQAETTPSVTHYLTADQECERVFDILKANNPPSFAFIHLSTPHPTAFGELDL